MGKKESIGTFKCCSDGKDLTCYYCIGCNTIQHKSCVERRKGSIYLGSFRIYCSKKCEETATENMTVEECKIIMYLRQRIDELQTELSLKSNSIEKQKRHSISTENDLNGVEEKYKEEIEKYQISIKQLEDKLAENNKNLKELKKCKEDELEMLKLQYKKEINDQEKRYKNLEKKTKDFELIKEQTKKSQSKVDQSVQSENSNEENHLTQIKNIKEHLDDVVQKRLTERKFYEEDTQKFKEDIEEQRRKINRLNLLNETLKKSLDKCDEEIFDLKNKLKQNSEKMHKNQQLPEIMFDKNNKPKEKKPQLLILGGRNDFGYGRIFKNISGNKYDTNCQNTDSSLFDDITSHHMVLSKQFSSTDFKIIFVCNENARVNKKITTQKIDDLVQSSLHTNIILVGPMLPTNNNVLKQLISDQNNLIEYCAKGKKNVSYVDSNIVLKEKHILKNGNVNIKGKWCLMKYIYDQHINKSSKYTQTHTGDHYYKSNEEETSISCRFTIEQQTTQKKLAQTQTGIVEKQYEETNKDNNFTVQEKHPRTDNTDLTNKQLRSSNCAEQGRNIFLGEKKR